MAASHKQLPLDQVVPGMVLSDQICNALGTVLLAQGTVVTEAMLLSLYRHKIETLPILFEVSPVADPEEEKRAQDKRLRHLFRKQDPDDASALLLQLVQRFRNEEAA